MSTRSVGFQKVLYSQRYSLLFDSGQGTKDFIPINHFIVAINLQASIIDTGVVCCRASITDVYRMSRHVAQIAAHQSGFKVPKMTGALHEIDHVGGRMNCQRMQGKAGPWGDIACHFARQSELVIRCGGKQRNHQILQRDDTDT